MIRKDYCFNTEYGKASINTINSVESGRIKDISGCGMSLKRCDIKELKRALEDAIKDYTVQLNKFKSILDGVKEWESITND